MLYANWNIVCARMEWNGTERNGTGLHGTYTSKISCNLMKIVLLVISN